MGRIAFILATPRSGTTLLRVMLAGHRDLFSPPEMILAPFETMRERHEYVERRYWEKGGLRRALMDLDGLSVDAARDAVNAMNEWTIPAVYASLFERIGPRMLVDKCPQLCIRPQALARIERWFPHARYVWLIRHPGSVMRSVENMPMAEVILRDQGVDAEGMWTQGNETIETFLDGVDVARKLLVRYEDLVKNPRPVLERVCATLAVAFDEKVLDPYEGDRMREGPRGARPVGDPNMAARGRIQPELATRWLDHFDPRAVARETRARACALGYDLDAMELPPIARVSDALSELRRTVRDAEASIRVPMDLDAVEGRRFLLRILFASVERFVEDADVNRPRFAHAESPRRKMFADCPDADHLSAPIRLGDGRAYRVFGRIPAGTVYVGVALYGKGGRVGACIDSDRLEPEADGRFELRIATHETAGVWLHADGDERTVIVRQYYTDRSEQRPIDIDIELVGTPPNPAPLEAVALAGQIGQARRMVEAVFRRTVDTYRTVSARALNRFISVPADTLFPTPDNDYRVAWYRVGDNQVMLIRGRLPRARYFGLSLCNAWLESYDYTRYQVNLNHRQITTDADGGFEVCVAHRDVGHPNWLDTAGHNAGYVIARALLGEGEIPELTTQIMYESELAAARGINP